MFPQNRRSATRDPVRPDLTARIEWPGAGRVLPSVHDPRCFPDRDRPLGRRARPRRRGRRPVRLRGGVDPHLLPALLPVPPAQPAQRPLLRHARTPPRRRVTGPAADAGRARRETDAVRRVRSAQRYLDQHLDETVTLERLGDAVGLSPYHLQRTFKRVTGVSPRAYAGARRMERMKSRLKQGDTVSRATYDAGYSSPSRVYDQSRARLGMTPGAYRNGGRGVAIRFTTVDTALGAAPGGGHRARRCASVTLGDDAGALEAALRREYPGRAGRAGRRRAPRLGRRGGRAPRGRRGRAGPARRRAARRSSGGCGRRCSGFRAARPGPTPRSRASSASRRRPARWPAPARPTGWRWSSPATASCGGTAGWADIAGASSGSGSCSRRRSRRPEIAG